ncbi:MAG: hypothetical protein ABIT61_07255 [Steroidobacteraceae bacterium]
MDPLEQTQENLHPVIVAHRARDPQPVGQGVSGSIVLLCAVVTSAVLLVWLLLMPHA